MTGFEVFKQGTTIRLKPMARIWASWRCGNMVMKGYLKSRKATDEALKDGWFRTSDLGIKYPDGYIKIMDRLKDIIISGGENISVSRSTRLIQFTCRKAAIVAAPHDKWGVRGLYRDSCW